MVELTIAIPAYNRPDTLNELLSQIEKQNSPDIQIIVADDCSPDNGRIQQVVGAFQKRNENFKFYRNDTNLGFSENVLGLYEKSESKYVWYLCDDDLITEGVIEKVVNQLKDLTPVVSILRTGWTNPWEITRITGSDTDVVYTDPKTIEYAKLMRMSFLSTLVLKTGLDTKKIRNSDYKENVFVQITLGLQLLTENFRFLESSILAVHRRVGFKYGDFYKFYLVDPLRSITAVEHGFDNKKFINLAIKELPTALVLYLSSKIGIFSYKTDPTERTYSEIKKFYGPLSKIIFLFPTIRKLTPEIFLRLCFFIGMSYYHGFFEGTKLYKKNIYRALKDQRKTHFHTYR